MDFMMDIELDRYLVLILSMLKKKKILDLKKNLKRFWETFKKRAVDGLYNSLVHELPIGDKEFHFNKFFE